MSCLKCGRETDEAQVFCQDCLLDMQKYPVRPGTAVMLPKRQSVPVPKKIPKKKGPTPEEQIKRLKLRIRLLAFALAFFILLSAALAVPTLELLTGSRYQKGQNYSVAPRPSLGETVTEN